MTWDEDSGQQDLPQRLVFYALHPWVFYVTTAFLLIAVGLGTFYVRSIEERATAVEQAAPRERQARREEPARPAEARPHSDTEREPVRPRPDEEPADAVRHDEEATVSGRATGGSPAAEPPSEPTIDVLDEPPAPRITAPAGETDDVAAPPAPTLKTVSVPPVSSPRPPPKPVVAPTPAQAGTSEMQAFLDESYGRIEAEHERVLALGLAACEDRAGEPCGALRDAARSRAVARRIEFLISVHAGARFAARGSFAQAAERYRNALKIDPVDAHVRNFLAYALYRMARKESAVVARNAALRDALSEADRSIELDPKNRFAYVNKIKILCSLRESQAIADVIRQATRQASMPAASGAFTTYMARDGELTRVCGKQVASLQ